jgi:hypothetical protein
VCTDVRDEQVSEHGAQRVSNQQRRSASECHLDVEYTRESAAETIDWSIQHRRRFGLVSLLRVRVAIAELFSARSREVQCGAQDCRPEKSARTAVQSAEHTSGYPCRRANSEVCVAVEGQAKESAAAVEAKEILLS